ncbi:MAG: hypothetical protein KDD62_15345, partial [Bdellovibrionales bacterium]|nr:hypothetical protein [Bdellovibrionales bacterium]
MKLVVRNETGTGRACVCITVPGFSAAVEGAIVQELSKTEKVLVIEVQGNLHGQWREALDQLREILAERRVRNASYVGIAAGSSLALQQAIENSKEVRRLSVIDGTTRPQPTWYEKCVDSLESKLPLGLPFRRKSELFDAKPYLQRVRCPVLVMSTPFGSMYTR